MSRDKIIYMANQIGRFFQTQKPETAVAGIEDHILKFWDPRMRKALIAHLAAYDSEFDPLVRKAAEKIAQRDGG